MDTPADGHILLVGEGDFSFCVAMVTKLPPHTHACVTATSLESEISIKKHRNAAENIQWLQDRGVTVYLDADATLLHSDPRFVGRHFSRVIFNFPHVGGKSNHKKNRQLLNDFFCSAVQVLGSDGQIMMTLCKGQGGTPSDRPMRAWHDSWQVVSMAANAGLILVGVVPFEIEDYTTYTSTGFRSLDKGFHTENALTHVFEMRPAVPLPDDSRGKQLTIGGMVYRCPAYLHNKLLALRYIYNNQFHPVRRVCHVLEHHLSSMTTLNCDRVNHCGIWTPVIDASIRSYDSDSVVLGTGSESCATSCSCFLETHRFKLTKCEDIVLDGDNIPDVDDLVSSGCIRDTEVFFKTCIHDIDMAGNVLPTDGQIVMQYGPIFEPCLITRGQTPVTFHMIVTCPLESCKCESVSPKQAFEAFTISLVQLVKKVIDRDDIDVKYVAKKEVLLEMSKAPTTSGVESKNLVGYLVSVNQDDLKYVDHNISDTHFSGADAGLDDAKSVKIGRLFLHHSTKDDLLNSYVMLDLDISKLAGYIYRIQDERLLWSEDQSVLKQFECIGMADKESNVERICVEKCSNLPAGKTMESISENTVSVLTNFDQDKQAHVDDSAATYNDSQEMDHKLRHGDRTCQPGDNIRADTVHGAVDSIASPSLYPMTFKHDMSFWENTDFEFDELSYCNVIRNVAGDCVVAVELLDTFYDEGSHRTSRCYRLTFQSVDKVLSYSTSWTLQSAIRLAVERSMRITLR